MDDRSVISGIIHVLRIGCRWEDCLPAYGPPTTTFNRFNCWSHLGLWGRIFITLAAQAELPDDLSIDSTAVRAHCSAHGPNVWPAPLQATIGDDVNSLHERIGHVGALTAAKMEIRASRSA